jgi:hypothetical protein
VAAVSAITCVTEYGGWLSHHESLLSALHGPWNGSTSLPAASTTSKCRCGMDEFPDEPTLPRYWPARHARAHGNRRHGAVLEVRVDRARAVVVADHDLVGLRADAARATLVEVAVDLRLEDAFRGGHDLDLPGLHQVPRVRRDRDVGAVVVEAVGAIVRAVPAGVVAQSIGKGRIVVDVVHHAREDRVRVPPGGAQRPAEQRMHRDRIQRARREREEREATHDTPHAYLPAATIHPFGITGFESGVDRPGHAGRLCLKHKTTSEEGGTCPGRSSYSEPRTGRSSA